MRNHDSLEQEGFPKKNFSVQLSVTMTEQWYAVCRTFHELNINVSISNNYSVARYVTLLRWTLSRCHEKQWIEDVRNITLHWSLNPSPTFHFIIECHGLQMTTNQTRITSLLITSLSSSEATLVSSEFLILLRWLRWSKYVCDCFFGVMWKQTVMV